MKRKINWGSVVNAMILLINIVVYMEYFYTLAIKPFISGVLTSITFIGCLVLIINTMIFNSKLDYFKNRLEGK